MHIALISEHASPLSVLGGVDSGGQNVYVTQLARHMSDMGHDVDVFTRRSDEEAPEVVPFAPHARVVHLAAGPASRVRKEELFPFMDEFASNLIRFAWKQPFRYDILHANFWMSGIAAEQSARELDVPFVIIFHALGKVRKMHQGKADEFPDERLAIEERLAAEARAIIVQCPQEEEDLVTLYNADPARIRLVPSGFDPAEFYPVDRALARRHARLDPQEPVILQLGRMVPRKGVETVVRAVGDLKTRYGKRVRLLIVGGESEDADPRLTPEIGRLEQIAQAEGVADQVTFAGRRSRDQLKYYYSAADIFVTVPWYEPFGLTPLEAMACGALVVGSRVGGIKFTVADGETGYLVPPKDPIALAERLAFLFDHPSEMAHMKARALARAHSQFTWENVARNTVAQYEEILAAQLAPNMTFNGPVINWSERK